jgi:transcriptional regulator with XRE-family HTH domain
MPSTTMTTGHALARARELAGLSERAAARRLGVPRSLLRDWESDTVVPGADDVEQAVRIYSADLDRVWPDRRPLVTPEEPGVLVVGDDRIDVVVDGVELDNRAVLTCYLAAVRRQRGLSGNESVELRADDISSLAGVLDLDDAELESLLTELLELTPAGARWTMRALVVGGLMAVGATAAVGSSWFSPATAATLDASASDTAAAQVVEVDVEAAPGIDTSDVELAEPVVQTPGEQTDAEDPTAAESPFSTEPSSVAVELAPAVFAVAPATEWSPVEPELFSTQPNGDDATQGPAELAPPPAQLPPAQG